MPRRRATVGLAAVAGLALLLAGCNESPFAPTPYSVSSWADTNVGDAWPEGLASSPDHGLTWVVQGGGTGMVDSGDTLEFHHLTVSGNVEVIARVADVQRVESDTAAGLMLRATVDSDAAGVSLTLTPGAGASAEVRVASGDDAYQAGTDPAATPPRWLRLRRVGTTVTASDSVDGVSWNRIASVDLSLPEKLLVGLTVSSNNDSTPATAVFRDTRVVTGAAVAAGR